MSGIVRLEAENVKRLEAVSITPDGNTVVIGGRNGAGKSSVIDSIMYALGGGGKSPAAPIRRGEKKASVEVELENLIVRRRWTESGKTYLDVESKEGAKYPSPQKMLDELVGELSFDPLEFSRMEPKRQAQTLRRLVGLDFADLDAKRKEHYDERTAVNRDAKALKNRLDSMPHHNDAPADEVSVSELLEERKKLDEQRQAADQHREQADRLDAEAQRSDQQAIATSNEIAELERKLAEAKERLEQQNAETQRLQQQAKAGRHKASNMPYPDLSEIDQRIATAEATNQKARENAQRAEVAEQYKAKQAESERLTEAIEAIDTDKADQLAAAEFPVDGLSFDEDHVLLNDLPFDQASSAEQLRVSVAMGLAMNPKLNVLLVRDGSLLDAESLEVLRDMATERDAQVWIERVSEGDEVSVVIEDGHVREAAIAKAEGSTE